MLKNGAYWSFRWDECSYDSIEIYDCLPDPSSLGDRLGAGAGDRARRMLILLAEYAGILKTNRTYDLRSINSDYDYRWLIFFHTGYLYDDWETPWFRQAIKKAIAPYFTAGHIYRSNSNYFETRFILALIKDSVGEHLNEDDSLFPLLSVILRHTGSSAIYDKIQDSKTEFEKLGEGRMLVEKPGLNLDAFELSDIPAKLVFSRPYGMVTDVQTMLTEAKNAQVGEKGFTELHLAAFNGDKRKVDELVKSGQSDINAKTEQGWTPLHLVVLAYFDDVFKRDALLAIARQVMSDEGDKSGFTPLELSLLCMNRVDYELTELLVNSGANVLHKGCPQSALDLINFNLNQIYRLANHTSYTLNLYRAMDMQGCADAHMQYTLRRFAPEMQKMRDLMRTKVVPSTQAMVLNNPALRQMPVSDQNTGCFSFHSRSKVNPR